MYINKHSSLTVKTNIVHWWVSRCVDALYSTMSKWINTRVYIEKAETRSSAWKSVKKPLSLCLSRSFNNTILQGILKCMTLKFIQIIFCQNKRRYREDIDLHSYIYKIIRLFSLSLSPSIVDEHTQSTKFSRILSRMKLICACFV